MLDTRQVNAVFAVEFFLCLFVIFIHVSAEGISVGDKTGIFSGVLFFINRTLSFVVPAFIFTSALKLTLKYKDTYPSLSYYRDRVARVYLPYVVWAAIYYAYFVANNYFDFSAGDLFVYIFNGTLAAHFYFIVVIMQFYVMLPLFLFFMKKAPVLTGLTVTIIMCVYRFCIPGDALIFTLLPADRWFFGYLIFWYMGSYYAFKFEECNLFVRKYAGVLLLICGAVALPHLAFSYAGYIKIFDYTHYFELVQILFSAVMLCGFYVFCMLYLDRFNTFYQVTKRYIFFVFLSHILVIFAAEDFLTDPGDCLLSKFLLKLLLTYCIPFAAAYIYDVIKKRLMNNWRSKPSF